MGIPPETDTPCPFCGIRKAQIFYNAHPLIRTNQVFPCKKCTKKIEVKKIKWYEKQATSVWKNPEGQEIALDQRGKTMDVPYKNREFDPHGWMQTHKRDFKKNLEKQGLL